MLDHNLRDQIRRICLRLDSDMFLTKDTREELFVELEELVEKRKKFEEVLGIDITD